MHRTKTVALLLALGLAPFVASWAYYTHIAEGAAAPYARGDARPFDREGWRGDYRHSRYLMVDDLLERHAFVGWERDAVEDLLGEAETTRRGFAYPAGEDFPGTERVPRSYALLFATGDDERVTRVWFTCRGEC